MLHEALWRALRAHLRDLQLHAQADMASLEEVPDIYRAQGSFRTIHDLLAFAEEAEQAAAEGRLGDDGSLKDPETAPS